MKSKKQKIYSPFDGILLFSLSFFFVSISAFAGIDDCKNPFEATLKGNIKMKFCDLPSSVPAKGKFKRFQMAQFTVTQQQYKAVTTLEPWLLCGDSLLVPKGDEYPATCIYYHLAEQFVHVLNLIDLSAEYRLPTAAEFEYAARAGTKTAYYWGDTVEIDDKYVYWNGNAYQAHGVGTCPNAEMDKKNAGYCANGFGLMHMLGNVWQWTGDADVDAGVIGIDESKLYGRQRQSHFVRGGSYEEHSKELRSDYSEKSIPPFSTWADLGFRVVRVTY